MPLFRIGEREFEFSQINCFPKQRSPTSFERKQQNSESLIKSSSMSRIQSKITRLMGKQETTTILQRPAVNGD
jgi:hypothetical protein